MRDDDACRQNGPDAGERDALDLLEQRHPWELTAEELVERMRSERGLKIEIYQDPEGLYLKRESRICPLPGIDRREVLQLDVVERIVESLGLERSDLQLDPADEG